MFDAKDAILKVKEYAEQGYTYAVTLDLSKYFDTLNHECLTYMVGFVDGVSARLYSGRWK